MGAEEGVLQRVHQSLGSSIIPFPPLLFDKWYKLYIKVTHTDGEVGSDNSD